jgi:hypothetical protein
MEPPRGSGRQAGAGHAVRLGLEELAAFQGLLQPRSHRQPLAVVLKRSAVSFLERGVLWSIEFLGGCGEFLCASWCALYRFQRAHSANRTAARCGARLSRADYAPPTCAALGWPGGF